MARSNRGSGGVNAAADSQTFGPSPAYVRTRKELLEFLGATIRFVEREQWDDVIECSCALIQRSARLLLMGEEA